MTNAEFLQTWTGKPCDFDKAFGYQCVDLMRQYLVDVYALPGYIIPALGSGGAKNIWTNSVPPNVFVKIKNTPLGVPVQGDIVIWKWYPFVTSTAGHVAIFQEGNVNTFVSFDQDYPTGSMPHLQRHDYRGVLGWLHKV